jgi:hypothetical protein
MIDIFSSAFSSSLLFVIKNIDVKTEGSNQNCQAILWQLYICGVNVEIVWGYVNIDVLEICTIDLAVEIFLFTMKAVHIFLFLLAFLL